MVNLKSFIAASAISALLSGVSASVIERWQQPLPSCNTTDFVYAGCFIDPSSPSALLDRTDLPSGNMTVQICIDFCKGNGYRYAGLEYYGECFCGASVGGPQTSESNCSLPCGGDQTEICGGNDIISVYQDKTFPTVNDSTIADYLPMGCYTDLGADGRTLAWRQDQLSETNLTIEECLFACKDGGYAFAGVEYAQECYCGVVLGNGTEIVNSTECAMPCTGNSEEICGGPALINLYVAKDLESREPCINGTESSSSTISTSSTTSSSSVSSSTTCTTTTSSVYSSSTSSKSSVTSSSVYSSTTSSIRSSSSTLSTTTTRSTPSLCTSTTVISATPTCEYQCGSWCSHPIPPFNDQPSCLEAYNSCNLQISSCFANAAWPNSQNCWQFSGWCSNIFDYCFESCPGNSCSDSNCKKSWPPSGPSPPPVSVSTSVYTCSASSTTAAPTSKSSTTSCAPVPTVSNICSQPNKPGKGYTSTSPVGGIALPVLTCNNVQSSFNAGKQLKLYTSTNPALGNTYSRNECGQGCQDACSNQYDSCISVYAQSCKVGGQPDTYSSATSKCYSQWSDCTTLNYGVSAGSRCGNWNQGWY